MGALSVAARGEEDAPEPTLDGTYEVFLDPTNFDPDQRVLVRLRDASPDERLVTYSVRQGDADEVEIRIRDLEGGRDLPDRQAPENVSQTSVVSVGRWSSVWVMSSSNRPRATLH